jgi:hypothetical protein
MLRRDVVGRVGLKLAAARVAPETAAGVSGFRAVDESPLICTKVSKTATYIHKSYRRPKLWSLLLELQIWHLVGFAAIKSKQREPLKVISPANGTRKRHRG